MTKIYVRKSDNNYEISGNIMRQIATLTIIFFGNLNVIERIVTSRNVPVRKRYDKPGTNWDVPIRRNDGIIGTNSNVPKRNNDVGASLLLVVIGVSFINL